MKKFTKMMIGVSAAVLVAMTTLAADTTVKAAGNPVAVETANVKSDSLFNEGECGLTLSTGYDLGESKAVNGKHLFGHPYTYNLTVGAFYFPWKYVGAEVNVPFYQTKGVCVDEVQAGILLRVPLAKEAPVFRNIAPYVGIGGVYNWQDNKDWAYIGKAGIEARYNKKWGIYAECQYRNYELKNWDQGAVSLQGGLRLVF